MDEKVFSAIDWVGQCLVDKKRTNYFKKAIKNVIKPNFIVFDVGTGSGIMSLFAAKFGAKKVYAFEYDPYVATVAGRNFANNGLNNKINIILGDAKKTSYDKLEKADLVIMEMLTTGMVDEFQVQAVNNLHQKKIVSKKTKFIPYKQETYATLTNANFNMYGFEMFSVYHLWEASHDAPVPIKITSSKTLSSINFNRINNESFRKIISFKALRDGEINSIYLQSRSFLSKDVSIDNTEAVNAPVLIPIQKITVKKGDNIKMEIVYRFGYGFGNFSAKKITKK